MGALLWHLAESSLFALIIGGVVFALKDQAAVRNRLWIAAVLKFIVPFGWFGALGATFAERFAVAPVHGPVLYAAAFENVGRQAAQVRTPSLLWTVCLVCWLGVSVMLLFMFLRRLARGIGKTVAAGSEEEAALCRCARRVEMGKIPRLRTASHLLEPCVRGTLRPVIVMPQGLYARLGEEVFEAVLTHELAHVKRKDNLWAMAVHVVVCLFPWYLPLWWMERRVREEAELACDALALEAGTPREAYLSGLVEVCRMSLLEPSVGSGFTSGVNLKDRLEKIMSNRMEGKSSGSLGQLGGALLAGCCCMAFALGILGAGRGVAQQTQAPVMVNATATGCEIGQPQPFGVGTVVRHLDSKILQVCVVHEGRPLWLTLKSEHQPTGLRVTDIPPTPVISCRETAPHGKLCTCDNLDFSPGSVVDSPHGKLACPASGGKWQRLAGIRNSWPPAPLH